MHDISSWGNQPFDQSLYTSIIGRSHIKIKWIIMYHDSTKNNKNKKYLCMMASTEQSPWELVRLVDKDLEKIIVSSSHKGK